MKDTTILLKKHDDASKQQREFGKMEKLSESRQIGKIDFLPLHMHLFQ